MIETAHPPADPRAPARRGSRGRWLAFTASALVMLLAAGGYSAAILTAPLPTLEPELIADIGTEFTVDPALAEEVVAAQYLPTAAGWLHDEAVFANTEAALPIASLSKLAAVLIGLEAQPVEPGTDGAVYTVSAIDQAIYADVVAQNGVAHETPEGLQLTTRQLLQLMLLPSSNNYAISYTNWVFGSGENFTAAAADWAARNNLTSLHLTEPSGLSTENVASPADIVRIGKLALEHPLVAEIVAQTSAEIPEIGEIESTNPLRHDPGVIGMKTGTLNDFGYNLLTARNTSVEGRDLTTLVAVLGRASNESRAFDSRVTLDGFDSAAMPTEIVAQQTQLGSVTTWQGSVVALMSAESLSTVLLPGESVSSMIEVSGVTGALPAGSQVGSLQADIPGGSAEVALTTADRIDEPDSWWRLTHPGIMFGWVDPHASTTP